MPTMAAAPHDPAAARSARRWLLIALLAVFAWLGVQTWRLLDHQPSGIDFMPLWTGAHVALVEPGRLYDFRHITDLQGWPLGPHKPRPYVYPPTTAFLMTPLALLPEQAAYVLFMAATAVLLAWTAQKFGGRWWLLLLPSITLVVFCGQLTLLIAALTLAALSLTERPIVAGVLLGLAAATKPQLFVLAPVALAAGARWRTLLASGLAGAALVALSAAIWGPGLWLDWLGSLPRFNAQVFGADPGLLADAVTPYAFLQLHHLPGAAAFVLIIPAVALVWLAFRRETDLFDRSIALFAGALLITPYAMNYEAALFAPAVAAYLARTEDRGWPIYAGLSVVYATALFLPLLQVLAPAALPLVRLAAARRSSPPEPTAA